MNNNYLRLADTLSGKEGIAFITTPDGKNRPLFEIISLDAKLAFKKTSKQTLGNRIVQHKVTGMEGTGSLKGYFISSDYTKLALDYLNSGEVGSLKIQITNEDSQSTIGKQTVVLQNILLDEATIAYLDVESEDPIQFESSFTFDNVELLESFTAPVNYK